MLNELNSQLGITNVSNFKGPLPKSEEETQLLFRPQINDLSKELASDRDSF